MSLTRPLTRSLTRALSNSELTQKLGGGFSIFALNPYLLFDARDSMIGTLENPTLDLNPALPETLDVITAARTGVATFTDANDNVASAPANTVRVDHVDSVPMILVEPSSENLLPYSEDFNDVSGSTKTTGIDAPDGSNNAERFSGALAINNVFANSNIANIPTGSAVDYVGSIYVRGTAGKTVNLFMKRAGAGPLITSGSLTVLLTGDWQRVENLSLTTDPANDGLRIFLSSASETADSVDVWGGQIESGSVSTSVIPTSGGDAAARTRAADDLAITGSDFDFYNQSEGTVYFEGTSNASNDPRLFEFSDGTSSNKTRIDINDGSNFRISVVNSGSGIVGTQVSFTGANSLFRAALSFKVNDLEGNLNGSSVINKTPASLPTVDQMHVGANHDGTGNYLNGHIKRLIYWPYHSDSL